MAMSYFLLPPFRFRLQQISVFLTLLLTLLFSTHAQAQDNGEHGLQPVSQERLGKGTAQYTDRLMYGGNYDNSRFSPLTDIDRQNVQKLSVAWVFQTGIPYYGSSVDRERSGLSGHCWWRIWYSGLSWS